MITRSRLLVALALCIASLGCTRHVRPSPKPPLSSTPLPLSAALVVSDELRGQRDRLGGYSTLGIGNTWVVDTGESFTQSFEAYARTLFNQVSVVSSAEDARADVVLIASPVSVTRQADSGPYALRFQMHVVAKDGKGQVGLVQQYTQDVQGSGLPAVSRGAYASHEVLGEPLERAMTTAFEQLGRDLRGALGN